MQIFLDTVLVTYSVFTVNLIRIPLNSQVLVCVVFYVWLCLLLVNSAVNTLRGHSIIMSRYFWSILTPPPPCHKLSRST